MEKKYAIKILGIPILFLCVLGSDRISAAQAEDLCGNALCEATESCITCGVDCSCGGDFEWNCADTVDNDLDDSVDCSDADCTGDLACVLISEVKAVPLKNLSSSQVREERKSVVPEKPTDFATATQHLAARVPPWIFPATLALVLSMILMWSRMQFMRFEDQDEW